MCCNSGRVEVDVPQASGGASGSRQDNVALLIDEVDGLS
jgi:hypothetical protein